MNYKTTFKTIENYSDLLIFRGSFVLNMVYKKHNINIKRDIKDLDADIKASLELGSSFEQVKSSIKEKLDYHFNNKIIMTENKNSAKFHLALGKNNITLLDIFNIKNIEYEVYEYNFKSIFGSSLNQIIIDKIDACLKNKKMRIPKDLNDLLNIVENINFKLLDVCDTAKMCKIDLITIQSLPYTTRKAIEDLNKIMDIEEDILNQSRFNIFETFINRLYEAYKVSKTIKINYPEKEIIQREYKTLVERNLISEDIYDRFWNFNNQSEEIGTLVDWV